MSDIANPDPIWLAIIVLAVLRLLNNLLKAAFYNLGQITQISLAEKMRDTRFWPYLDNSARFSFAAQTVDKAALFLLFMSFMQIEPSLTSWGIFAAYLFIFDLIIPMAVGAFLSEAVVVFLMPVMHVFYLAVSPLTLVMIKITDRGREHEEANYDEEDSPDDIKAFIRAGSEEGIIEEHEGVMLQNLLTFSDTVVREIMTPRTDIVCVEISEKPEDILEVFKRTKLSRLPVYDESIDNIKGILRVKDLIEIIDHHDDIAHYLKKTIFIPEGKNTSDLLQEMMRQRMQMVVVIDEYGGTAGLITLEDLIEEIIGEIHDEHEEPDADEIINLGNGEFLVDGKVALEDFCDMFNTDVDIDDVDTVGGYIFHTEGLIPEEGSATTVGSIPVEITRSDERRIYQVKVQTPEQDESLAS